MAGKIKGITIEIDGDTRGLNNALSDVNKTLRETESDLKSVERGLKLDPQNTELLNQKIKLLGTSIEQTSKKLDTLREAEKQAQQQLANGDITQRQYDSLKRDIIFAEQALNSLEKEAENANNALNQIDDSALNDIKYAANDASDALGDIGKKSSNFKDVLGANLIAEGAKSIISSLKDVYGETTEYRQIMASLSTSSDLLNIPIEQTTEDFRTLYGVLGDTQSAATTISNLQSIGLSAQQTDTIINASIGAWAKYGDSIPIDGLAEAINETIRVGQVTGTFADVLNWAGTSEDSFNASLASASDESERANLVLQELANQGLVQAGEEWQKNNQSLVDNRNSQIELQEQLALLAQSIEPVLTAVTTGISKILSVFTGLDSGTQNAILALTLVVAAIGPLISLVGNLGTAVNGLSSAFAFLAANPIVAVIAIIVSLGVAIATNGEKIISILSQVDDFLQNIFAKDFTNIFGPVLGGVLNNFFGIVSDVWDGIKTVLTGVIDFISGVFSADWRKAWEGVKSIFSGIVKTLGNIFKVPINAIISMLNFAIDGLNTLISGLNKIRFDIPDWVPLLGGKTFGLNIPKIGEIPLLGTGGVLYRGTAIVGENGPEVLTVSGSKAIVRPLTDNGAVTDKYLQNSLSSPPITVDVQFSGSLAALGRVLQPVIIAETNRIGKSLVIG